MDRTFYFCFNQRYAGTAFRLSTTRALTAYHTLADGGITNQGNDLSIELSVFDQSGASHAEQWRLVWYCADPDVDVAIIEIESRNPDRDYGREQPQAWHVEWREKETDWWRDERNAPSIEAFLPDDWNYPCSNPRLEPIPGNCLSYERDNPKWIQYTLKDSECRRHHHRFYNGASGSPAYSASSTKVFGVAQKWSEDGPGHFVLVKTAAIAQRWDPLKVVIPKWKEGEAKVLEGLLDDTLTALIEAVQGFSDARLLAPQELLDLIDLVQADLLLPLDGYAYRSSDMADMVLRKDWKGVVYDYCPTIQAFFRQIGQQVTARKRAQDLYREEPPDSWLKRVWWRTPWAQLERLNRAKELYSYSRVGRMHQ